MLAMSHPMSMMMEEDDQPFQSLSASSHHLHSPPVPVAPPLTPETGVRLFTAQPSSASSTSQPFRAKWTPYRDHGGGGSGASTTSVESGQLSSPSPSSQISTPWKEQLRAQCIERVKAHRTTLRQKLRHLPNQAAHTSPTLSPSPTAPLTQTMMAAHDSLENSLRQIIQEQLHHRRPTPPPAAASSSSNSYLSTNSFSSTSSFMSSSNGRSSSAFHSSTRGGVLQSSSAVAEIAANSDSFTVEEGEEGLSTGEWVELMSHLQEEVMRELEVEQFAIQEYDEEAAAQMEADQLAFESAQKDVTPCPCCYQPISVSASSTGICGAVCPCGLRYACDSLQDFKQHISEALDVHSQRCPAQPKFIATRPTSLTSVPLLALACEACQTWLTLPVQTAMSGWNSAPNSQPENQDQDHDMAT